MKRMKGKILRIIGDNRGSGIVMVLIAMVCITLLGATLMYMSYIALSIKATDRKATEDFYDAATALDEIRGGLQLTVSDAVAEAYKTVLVNYNNAGFIPSGSSMEAEFRIAFQNELKGWQVVNGGGSAYHLFQNSNTQYNPDALKELLKAGSTAVVSSVSGTVEWYATEVVLKNVQVSYTDATNYTTNVSSDIVIKTPDFTYILAEYSLSGLPEFVLIAKDTLTQTGTQTSEISGNAYVGSMRLDVENSSLILKNGTMVCGGKVELSKSPGAANYNLIEESSSIFWAKRIELKNHSAIKLSGDVYVADDLEFVSGNTKALLEGRYFGFGNSTVNPDASSAILINAMGATLDMSNLKRLMLAGHSFITNSYEDLAADRDNNSNTLMSGSLSTRRDQTAYLVPGSYFATGSGVGSNPMLGVGPEPVVLPGTDKINLLTDEANTVLRGFGAKVKRLIAQVRTGGTPLEMTYYFLDFNGSAANANRFYADYFAANIEEIQTYLNSYINDLKTGANVIQAAGYVVDKHEDNTYGLNAISGNLGTSAAQMTSTYKQLVKTLYLPNAPIAVDNPYQYFVKEDEMNAIGAAEVILTFYGGNVAHLTDEVKGYVVKGDFTVDVTTPVTAKIIIATGDVTVKRDFNGLIIAGGKVILSNANIKLTSSANEVAAALSAIRGESDGATPPVITPTAPLQRLGHFLRDGIVADLAGDTIMNSSAWNYKDLVDYRNWAKY